ncbi:MAG: NAD(P)H-dependent glycerol-3-phosphate dehydrogenase [bacterium]
MILKVGVVSAGSWGTALATLMAEKGYDVTIWAKEKEIVDSINKSHRNCIFLKEIELSERIKAVNLIQDAVIAKNIVIVATPAQYTRDVLKSAANSFSPDTFVVLASKGIENSTLQMMYEVAAECLPGELHKNIFVISGPTFALELAKKMPTCAVIAGENSTDINFIQSTFSSPYMRIYSSNDVTGVELGGALKNIFAIAVGVLEGMGFGKNTQAALITRSIAEMGRLVVAMGGNPLTVSGLSGIGDLILTCTGDLSRNRQVGIRLGKGEKIEEIQKSMLMIAEGVPTAKATYNLSKKMNVEMPITETLYKVLYENSDIFESFQALMTRSLKDELLSYGGKNGSDCN